MSAELEYALASLDEDALKPQIRHIVNPHTGDLCAVEMPADLWRGFDDLAEECQTTSNALCRFALLEAPEIDLVDALWLFLQSVYVRPPQGDVRLSSIH